jgi:phosphohistidine swiveling domain-containing protein
VNGAVVATGTVASEGTVTGRLTAVGSIEDVIRMMKEDLGGAILLTEHASVTSVVPILPRVGGVICRGGGVTSHIAIVSRQLGLPCVVGARFEGPSEVAEGTMVKIDSDGRILAVGEN